MKIEITTRDEQIDGTWCDVPYVTIRKSEFDAFMAAYKRLVEAAESVEWYGWSLGLEAAINECKKLEVEVSNENNF